MDTGIHCDMTKYNTALTTMLDINREYSTVTDLISYESRLAEQLLQDNEQITDISHGVIFMCRSQSLLSKG